MANRAQGRKAKKPKIKQIVKEEIIKNQVKRVAVDVTTSTIMAAVSIALHEELGFGQKRITRIVTAVSDLFGKVLEGETTIDEIQRIAVEELGIKIKLTKGE